MSMYVYVCYYASPIYTFYDMAYDIQSCQTTMKVNICVFV